MKGEFWKRGGGGGGRGRGASSLYDDESDILSVILHRFDCDKSPQWDFKFGDRASESCVSQIVRDGK
jgi:hypothetical protein